MPPDQKYQKIPNTEYKAIIKNEWYPNTPNYLLKQDIINIQRRLSNEVTKNHVKSYEIVEIFILHGKPEIFSQQDFDQYIKAHEKKQPFMDWLKERKK